MESTLPNVKNCIYYDLEDISSDDVRRARRRASGATEFIAHGAIWPPDAPGPRAGGSSEPRDFGYQEELMVWVNRLFEGAGGIAGGAEFHHAARCLAN